jgi:transposase
MKMSITEAEDEGKCLSPFQRKLLIKQHKLDLRTEYLRRIEIMLLADSGQSQAQICDRLGCSQETARHWMFVARSGNAHLWDRVTVGRPKTVSDEFLTRLTELVEASPRDFGYSFQRWTANWLAKHLYQEFEIFVSDRHICRLLKGMGLSTRSSNACANASQASNLRIRDLKPVEQLMESRPIPSR